MDLFLDIHMYRRLRGIIDAVDPNREIGFGFVSCSCRAYERAGEAKQSRVRAWDVTSCGWAFHRPNLLRVLVLVLVPVPSWTSSGPTSASPTPSPTSAVRGGLSETSQRPTSPSGG